jgi:hypothetical protein
VFQCLSVFVIWTTISNQQRLHDCKEHNRRLFVHAYVYYTYILLGDAMIGKRSSRFLHLAYRAARKTYKTPIHPSIYPRTTLCSIVFDSTLFEIDSREKDPAKVQKGTVTSPNTKPRLLLFYVCLLAWHRTERSIIAIAFSFMHSLPLRTREWIALLPCCNDKLCSYDTV